MVPHRFEVAGPTDIRVVGEEAALPVAYCDGTAFLKHVFQVLSLY